VSRRNYCLYGNSSIRTSVWPILLVLVFGARVVGLQADGPGADLSRIRSGFGNLAMKSQGARDSSCRNMAKVQDAA